MIGCPISQTRILQLSMMNATDFSSVCNDVQMSSDGHSKIGRAAIAAAYLSSHTTKLFQDPVTKIWKTAGNMSEGEFQMSVYVCVVSLCACVFVYLCICVCIDVDG